jgi:hypothetical protein
MSDYLYENGRQVAYINREGEVFDRYGRKRYHAVGGKLLKDGHVVAYLGSFGVARHSVQDRLVRLAISSTRSCCVIAMAAPCDDVSPAGCWRKL